MSVVINGFCDSRFQRLADIFETNFKDTVEVGASMAITREGETVVDLWGGLKDQDSGAAWEANTLVLVFSSTKFATTLCALQLIDQGKLDPEKPITHYWPEFATNGKEKTLVKHIFSHSTGVFCFDPPCEFSDQYDWEGILARLASQKPEWESGTESGYHAWTYGFLVGALVHRISGMTPGQYLKKEITGPLGIDFHLGSSTDELARMAKIIPFEEDEEVLEPGTRKYKAANQFLGSPWAEFLSITGELPSANGLANGRSLAQLASILAMNGTLNGYEVLAPKTVDLALTELAYSQDTVEDVKIRWGFGFGLNSEEFECPSNEALHWGGGGGSVLIADRRSRTSFGYAMNYMYAGFGDDPRTNPMRIAFNEIARAL